MHRELTTQNAILVQHLSVLRPYNFKHCPSPLQIRDIALDDVESRISIMQDSEAPKAGLFRNNTRECRDKISVLVVGDVQDTILTGKQ